MTSAAPEPAFVPECTACGFCCFFDDPRYVLLFEEDLARFGELAAELTVTIKGRSFMRSEAGHCIALKLAPTTHERWLCAIHELRPRLCREFERGCDSCKATVRERHPLSPKRRLPVTAG